MELREIIQRSKSRPEVYAPALAVEALNLRAEVESLRATISRLEAENATLKIISSDTKYESILLLAKANRAISRLRGYADHKITCGTLSADYFIEKQGCDCGYDTIMKEIGG